MTLGRPILNDQIIGKKNDNYDNNNNKNDESSVFIFFLSHITQNGLSSHTFVPFRIVIK